MRHDDKTFCVHDPLTLYVYLSVFLNPNNVSRTMTLQID
jgi:hypothetical protein